MDTYLTGRYWKKDNEWVATLPGLSLVSRANSAHQNILRLKEMIKAEYDQAFSVSVTNDGVFYFVTPPEDSP